MTESIQYGVIWEADPERIGIAMAAEGKSSPVVAYVAQQAHERPETWKTIPGASKYEVSDKGQVRRDGHILAQRPSGSGYLQVNYTDDTRKKRTSSVHRLVLLAHAPRPKKGEESCHGKYGQRCNWYPENLRWGTKPENEADKDERPQPAFPCRNAPTCGNMNIKEGRRCPQCSDAEGRKIARKLNAGMNLEVAAMQSDLTSDWAFKIAVKAGYAGTIRQARLQQPSVTERLRITLRDRRPDGWGDAT